MGERAARGGPEGHSKKERGNRAKVTRGSYTRTAGSVKLTLSDPAGPPLALAASVRLIFALSVCHAH